MARGLARSSRRGKHTPKLPTKAPSRDTPTPSLTTATATPILPNPNGAAPPPKMDPKKANSPPSAARAPAAHPHPTTTTTPAATGSPKMKENVYAKKELTELKKTTSQIIPKKTTGPVNVTVSTQSMVIPKEGLDGYLYEAGSGKEVEAKIFPAALTYTGSIHATTSDGVKTCDDDEEWHGDKAINTWIEGRKYAKPTTAGAKLWKTSSLATSGAQSQPSISNAIFSAATGFEKKPNPITVLNSPQSSESSRNPISGTIKRKGTGLDPPSVLEKTPKMAEKTSKTAGTSTQRPGVSKSKKETTRSPHRQAAPSPTNGVPSMVVPTAPKEKQLDTVMPHVTEKSNNPPAAAPVAWSEVQKLSVPAAPSGSPTSAPIQGTTATPASQTNQPKSTRKSKVSSKKLNPPADCKWRLVIFQASETAVGINMVYDRHTALTMQEGREWGKAVGELLRTDELFQNPDDIALAAKIAPQVFDSKQFAKYVKGESFEFTVKATERCMCPEKCGEDSKAVSAQTVPIENQQTESQATEVQSATDDSTKVEEEVSPTTEMGWTDFYQFEQKIAKMIAKCLEAELFSAPQAIRLEILKSVNGDASSSNKSLDKLLDYVKTSSTLKAVCRKASRNPRYSENESELIETILLKYATSLTDDDYDSENDEKESMNDDDESLEYKTVIEDYFRSKNLSNEEKKELWEFIDYWSTEDVPVIVWDENPRGGLKRNGRPDAYFKKIDSKQRAAVYEAIESGHCRPVHLKSLDEKAAELAEDLLESALCADPDNHHHDCCYNPDEAQAGYREKIEYFFTDENCRYIQQREILHMLSVYFNPTCFDCPVKARDYDSLEEYAEALKAHTRTSYPGISKPQYRINGKLCRLHDGRPVDTNPSLPNAENDEECTKAYRLSWKLACADKNLMAAIEEMKVEMGIRIQQLNVKTAEYGEFVVLRAIDEDGNPTDGKDLIAIEKKKPIVKKKRKIVIAYEELDDAKCVRPRNKTKGGTKAPVHWVFGELIDAMGIVDRSQSGMNWE